MKIKDAYKRNFRDLSYLKHPVYNGLKEGCFFRSGCLKKFKPKSLQALLDAGLKTVIDLRTPGEIGKKPDPELPGVTNIQIPVLREETIGITHERGLKAYKQPPHMPDLYASLLCAEESIEGYKHALSILLDPNREGAVLFHCTAGKDRAGILAALFLLILGYKEEDVFNDYLKSDKHSRRIGHVYRALIYMLMWKKKLGDSVYEAMRAKDEFLQSALDAAAKKAGDFNRYVREVLGIDEERVAAFWRRYARV